MIAGDGGFQCNIQELQTVVRNKLPIKIIIVNNKTHGMVRQFQDSYLGQRYQSTLWGYDAPDFLELAKAVKRFKFIADEFAFGKRVSKFV